jgi:hypothetical protein
MKTCIRFLLLLCTCTVMWAQDDQLDEFTIEDVPQEDVSTPYFGVGGGVIGSFFFGNMDEVNTLVDRVLPGQKIDGPILMVGAQGFAAIPFIRNARIGFMSIGGSKMVEGSVPAESLAVARKRQFEYSLSYNAITFDYAFTPLKGLALIPGVAGGWGSITMRAAQSSEGAERAIDGELNFGSSSSNLYRELSASHITFMPNLNIEYAITPFSMIRLDAGYNITASVGDWEADNGIATVSGVSDKINMSGFSAQIGVFIGLFNH